MHDVCEAGALDYFTHFTTTKDIPKVLNIDPIFLEDFSDVKDSRRLRTSSLKSW